MIENQVDVKIVSELLGHSSIEITLNTYVHSTDEGKRAAANVQRKLLYSTYASLKAYTK